MAFLKIPVALALAMSAMAQSGAPPIKLNVDAAEATRRLPHARMQLPVKPGTIEDLVGIKVTGNGNPIRRDRDPVNMYEFHIEVPAGVSVPEVSADFISPQETGGFSSGRFGKKCGRL